MRISTQRIEDRQIDIDSILHEEGRFDERIESEFHTKVAKPQQFARALPEETVGLDCVQAYISNMSAPTSLDELYEFGGYTLPENIMESSENEWTSPRWAKAGDIVFFMHSKTARTSLTRLRTELKEDRRHYQSTTYNELMSYIEHALDIHATYGGKIFAIGRVCGGPEYETAENILGRILHWKSRHYSAIDNIVILEKPVDIAEFNSFIQVSRGSATTPIFDNEFNELRSLIGKKNSLPDYVAKCVAKPIPLRMINKDNWIQVANDFRRCFILESQFRAFYVDYLLRAVGDRKTFHTECRCQRSDINDSFMDYVILFNGKYLPVETKLAVSAEPNIIGQVSKYVDNSRVYLSMDENRFVTGDSFHAGKVLVIDTEKIYMFRSETRELSVIYNLDDLNEKKDLDKVKKEIVENLT